MRSPEAWKQLIHGKTPLQMAQIILSDLVGYRKTSLHRSDDLDTIVSFITALQASKT